MGQLSHVSIHYIMTSKQLKKLAKAQGWILKRQGSKHMIYEHTSLSKQITIPYQVRDFVGRNIAKQLTVSA